MNEAVVKMFGTLLLARNVNKLLSIGKYAKQYERKLAFEEAGN